MAQAKLGTLDGDKEQLARHVFEKRGSQTSRALVTCQGIKTPVRVLKECREGG